MTRFKLMVGSLADQTTLDKWIQQGQVHSVTQESCLLICLSSLGQSRD